MVVPSVQNIKDPNENFSAGFFCVAMQWGRERLYLAVGSPAASGCTGFSDVTADAYYAATVTWGRTRQHRRRDRQRPVRRRQ